MIMESYRGSSSVASTAWSVATAASALSMLPWDFVPGNRDVICGKAAKRHSGNEWCRSLVASEMQIYKEEKRSGVRDDTTSGGETSPSNSEQNKKPSAFRRREKTEIVARVVRKVKCTSPMGGFVRMDVQQGRWVQVDDEQACRKVLDIMQDVMESRRYLQRGPSSPSNVPSHPSLISADAPPYQASFLEEYVSKQTAALKENKSTIFSSSENQRRKRRRIMPSRNRTMDQQLPQEDLQLQSFLGNLAAGMPDVVVDNPFEPNPIVPPPSSGAQSQAQAQEQAFYDSAVARLFSDLLEDEDEEGGTSNSEEDIADPGAAASVETSPGSESCPVPPPSPAGSAN